MIKWSTKYISLLSLQVISPSFTFTRVEPCLPTNCRNIFSFWFFLYSVWTLNAKKNIYIYTKSLFYILHFCFHLCQSYTETPAPAPHKVHHIRKVRTESDRKRRRWDRHRLHVTGDTWKVTCDMWQVTHDRWQVICDSWHMTGDRWHMTHGVVVLGEHSL